MARARKVDVVELAKMRAEGKGLEECAERFGVTPQAIKLWLRALNKEAPRAVLVEPARVERAVDSTLDVMSEWARVRDEINQLLDLVKRALNPTDDKSRGLLSLIDRAAIGCTEACNRRHEHLKPDWRAAAWKLDQQRFGKGIRTALEALRRLQLSLDQWIRVAGILHDWEAQREFQEEVLAVVAEVAPDARAEIVRRLSERRSLRLAFGGPPGPGA